MFYNFTKINFIRFKSSIKRIHIDYSGYYLILFFDINNIYFVLCISTLHIGVTDSFRGNDYILIPFEINGILLVYISILNFKYKHNK